MTGSFVRTGLERVIDKEGRPLREGSPYPYPPVEKEKFKDEVIVDELLWM